MDGLKHQKEKRSMDYFTGLDVSVKETSVCIVDDTGKIVREVKDGPQRCARHRADDAGGALPSSARKDAT